MNQVIKRQLPVAEAIARLMHPHAEVVLHDIECNCVAAIYNGFSQRQVGDISHLTEADMPKLDDCLGPYPKTNWDGRALKSVSSVLRDDAGRAVGLLCINFDVSQLRLAQEVIDAFVRPQAMIEQPRALFADDWHERINHYVHQYLLEHQLTLDSISRSDKKNLVGHLQDIGAFSGKNSATYIARVLQISRATVYKYLKNEGE
ncbi:MAG: PAS domain-containing protein [Pseudomonadota bacterium]|nr:PAS domain-containing protein [Pseudomonadota bacterium]